MRARRPMVVAVMLACLPAAVARAQQAAVVHPLPAVDSAAQAARYPASPAGGPLAHNQDRPPLPPGMRPLSLAEPVADAAQPVSYQEPQRPRGVGLQLPKNLPGASAAEITLPPYDPIHPEARLAAIDRIFPPLQPLPADIMEQPGPNNRGLTVGELENIALGLSPVIRQAEADITSARGNAIQLGTPPNPTVGYEGDTIGSGSTPNYHGAYFNTWVKTAGKLQLAQAAAMIDVRNAELALRKARIALITQVQARYYAVLVAEEAVRTNEALARFTDQAYRIQIEQLRGGEAAAYEPMQLRVLAIQARATLVQARNRYYSAWKQLAAIVNRPDLPPTQLAGNLNVPIPLLRFEPLKNMVWDTHPDILAARNGEEKARINLRFEEVTPIPDLYLYSTVQKDYTPNSAGQSFNVQVGLPIPFFDRNVGGILQAQGQLASALQLATRTRNDLTTQLADAFERYENNRALLEYYRANVLPDQSRAYRGVYERHQQQPDRVGFADVVVAQQTYSAAIANYIVALTNQWQAVTDLLNTVQMEDLIDLQDILMRVTVPQAPPENVPAGPLPEQPIPPAR